jgi:hypothetical protein
MIMTVEANDERWDIFLDAYARLAESKQAAIQLCEDVLEYLEIEDRETFIERLMEIKDGKSLSNS